MYKKQKTAELCIPAHTGFSLKVKSSWSPNLCCYGGVEIFLGYYRNMFFIFISTNVDLVFKTWANKYSRALEENCRHIKLLT